MRYLALLLILATLPGLAARNLLENGTFAKGRAGVPDGWGMAPAMKRVVTDGVPRLHIASDIVQYAVAQQYLPLDGTRVQAVRLTGRVRYHGVKQGRHDYDRLRVFFIWFGAGGAQVGDYANVGLWVGASTGWVHFDQRLPIPVDTKRAVLAIGLHDCSGTADFTDLSLTVAQGDASFDPQAGAQTDTRGWWAFHAKETPAAGTAIDLSALNDTPAGKHGFLTARDGHLYFADGTRARFWGFDIMAEQCFPDHATAERLAARLARMGVNMMRLHHMDAWWSDPNIFDDSKPDTQHLSPAHLERLDYFIAQLKKRGIYLYFDWLVNRKFKRGDGVPDAGKFQDGAKIVAHFDPKIIVLEKRYMAQVLAHKNPYTGLRYVDEPQIALSEVINEDSLFYEDWYDQVPPRYLRELTALCRQYEPKANPAHHPFDAPTLRALYRIESGYFHDMGAYLRGLGMKCPLTGSNHWENMGPELLCDAETDYIDRHYYWDHPKVDFGWFQEFDNLPMLADPENSLPPVIAATKIAGKPMVVTEWCCCWINDTVAAGPLVGAATACQQDWDVMLWFDISAAAPDSAMENEFDIANKPHLFAQWAAATLLFRRGDVPPLPLATVPMQRSALLAGASPADTIDPTLVQHARVELAIDGKATPTPPPAVNPVAWDTDKATYQVHTPCTMALDGALHRAAPYDLGWAKVTVRSDFCVLWATALDGKALADSAHILITVAARAENTGQRFNTGRTHLTKPGTAPIRIEPVRADVAFTHPYTIRPLGPDGIPHPARTAATLHLDDGQTFWYELTRK